MCCLLFNSRELLTVDSIHTQEVNTANTFNIEVESPSRDKRIKVLIVDDSTAIQKVMKRWLESNGCIVTGAENGKVGLTLLKEQSFDFAFMDFLMVRSYIICNYHNHCFYSFLSSTCII